MIFPSGVSSSAAFKRLGSTRKPIARSIPALRAKTRHFRIILQISIAVGKESTAGCPSTAGGLNRWAGHITHVKRYPGRPAGSRSAVEQPGSLTGRSESLAADGDGEARGRGDAAQDER